MSFKPITVNTPTTDPAHILAQDDATLYHGIIGQDCVLDIGSKMEAVIIDNNTVRILDGAVMVQGHLGHIPHGEYEDLHIENGVAGQKRHDLIVARFKTTAGIDTYELAVIKGVPGSSGVDPDITVGNLSAGDMLREYPLYRVKIDGLLLASIERMHTVGSTIDILHQSLESHLADYETHKENVAYSGVQSPDVSQYITGNFQYYKSFGTVFFTITHSRLREQLGSFDSRTIFTLPSGFRPRITSFFPLVFDANTAAAVIQITSNGNVVIHSRQGTSISTNAPFIVSGCFPV